MAEPTLVAESATTEPVQSIETDLKQEDAAEEKSDEDAEAEEDEVGGDSQGVSSEQYKALRNIAEILTNYKIKVKGDE